MSKLSSILDRQFFVGFDNILDNLDTAFTKSDKFPPHDVIKTGDHTYSVVLAVAGFSKKDIQISLDKNLLTIKGSKVKEYEFTEHEFPVYPRYIYNGISNRNFTKQFSLQPQIVVKTAKVEDGILTICLEEIVPDSQKSRSISID